MKKSIPEAYKYEKKSNSSTSKTWKIINTIVKTKPKTVTIGATYIINISKHAIFPVFKKVPNNFLP